MCLPVANRDKELLFNLLTRIKTRNALGEDGISYLTNEEFDVAERYLEKSGYFRLDFGRCNDSGAISWNSKYHKGQYPYLPFLEDLSTLGQQISVSQEPTQEEAEQLVEIVFSESGEAK